VLGSAGKGGFSRLKPRGFGPTNIVSHCGLDCRVARQSDAMMHKEADGADEFVGLPRDNPHRQFLARQMSSDSSKDSARFGLVDIHGARRDLAAVYLSSSIESSDTSSISLRRKAS
jgi:hypothetical protein